MNTKVTGVAAYLQTVVRSEKPRGIEYMETSLGYVAYTGLRKLGPLNHRYVS